MTIETPASGTEADGSALPLPRAFGETNTMTVPERAHSSAPGWDAAAAAWLEGSADARPQRIAIVAADPSALTLTF